MDRGAWLAAVYGVAKSQTWLSNQHFHFHFHHLNQQALKKAHYPSKCRWASSNQVMALRVSRLGYPKGRGNSACRWPPDELQHHLFPGYPAFQCTSCLLDSQIMQLLEFSLKYLNQPTQLGQKRTYLQCRRPRFDPWVGEIPQRRIQQPTPVFLPGESHGQRSLVGCSPWGHKESGTTEQHITSLHTMSVALILPLSNIHYIH